MAYDNSFTAVVGATYTAAQYNTHVRDNLTAIWVYTSAGDIAYATSATALARLAKGTAYQHLRMNAGATAPEWGGWIAGKVTRTTTQSVPSAILTNINFTAAAITRLVTWSSGDDTKLTIGAAGLYLFGFSYSSEGGAGYREANVLLNGSTILETRYSNAAGENTFVTGTDIKGFAVGNYLQLQVRHNEVSSLNYLSAGMFAAFLGA
jgi:hypothetical protein